MHKITVCGWRSTIDPGPMGKEKVHFEAPGADRLEKEMQTCLNWLEGDDNIDPAIRAGIAHLWYITIHPFEDGNERIARAIGDMALARADGARDRFYSLSSQIEVARKHYYVQLAKQQRATPDITDWLS